MSNRKFEEILAICKRRANSGIQPKANRGVIRENTDSNTTSVVYRIPHSDNQYALTSNFEDEGFSLIPMGDERHPVQKYTEYWEKKRYARDWNWENYKIIGIQLFTGHASKKEIEGVLHYPICWDIEVGLYLEFPGVFEQILHWALDIPDVNIIITKSGGFRVNAWVPFVLPKSKQIISRREWKDSGTGKTIGITYAEILSEKGMARIDDQYWQAAGEIAKWPILTKEEFLIPLPWIESLDARIRRKQDNKVLDEELSADLPTDLSWRPGTHILISTKRYDCEMGHKSNPTVEYRKYTNESIVRVCYACGSEPIVVRSGKHLYQKTEGGKIVRNRTQQKLYRRSEDIKLATREENQARIKDAVSRQERVILIKGGTGDGKSEAMIDLAINGTKIFIGVSTQKIANELESRFNEKDLDVLRWRTPTHGLTNEVKKLPIEERIPNGALCAIGNDYTNYQQVGGNPHNKLCPKCEVFDMCKIKGLLAQRKRLREADVVIMCFPQLVTNPACENTAIRYLELLQEPVLNGAGNLIPKLDNAGKSIIDIFGDPVYEYEKTHRVAVFDDASLTKMFPEFSLKYSQVKDWCERWEGEALGEFAEELRVALRKKDSTPMLRDVVSNVSDAEGKHIAEQMCALRYNATFIKQPTSELKGRMHIAEIDKYIPVARDMSVYNKYSEMKQPILKPYFEHRQHLMIRDLNRAVSLGLFDLESNTSISAMPKLPSNRDWTPWHALKSLFDEYPYDHMVPITYKAEYLIWRIHPKLHENMERIIIMGASLDIQLAKDTFKPYADSMFALETLPTEWVDGRRFFQICTGKYPRGSLLNRNSNTYEYVSFSPTGNKMFNLIRREMKLNPDAKIGIITFNWVVKNYKQKWQKKFPQLVYFENFQCAEGTNPEIDILFIVGTPEIPEDAVINTAKYMFGGTEHAKTPLNTSRCDSSDFSGGCPYQDWRIQVAWQHEVRELVMQAIGRARLNLYPRTVVALSGIWLPDITDRKETVLFVLPDWEVAGSLDRLQHETQRSAAIHKENEQLEDEIGRRIDQGETQRYIAGELDTTTYQVRKVSTARCACNNLSTAGKKVDTLREKILTIFQSTHQLISTSELISEFQQHRPDSIKKAIGKLRKSGLIVRVKHGFYQLLDQMEYDRCCDEIRFLFHLERKVYTNLQIAEILGRSIDEVNKALSDLIDAGWFATIKPDERSSTRFIIPVLPGEPFEVVTENNCLLARGSVYPGTIFMLCDYKLLEAEEGVEEFVGNCAERMGLQPDIPICYDFFENWSVLPYIV